MTYRYYNVRREICKDTSEKEINKYRSFNDLKKLYTPFHWIVFALMILSLASVIAIAILSNNILWCSVPMFIIIVCSKLWDSKAEKLYNKEGRENELRIINSAYEDYLKSIKNILIKNGIDTEEKCNCLKEECLSIFKRREAKYSLLNNKVFEMLIGVPIGVLISTVMYKYTEAIPIQVAAVLLLGIMSYALISFAKFITYHTEGYWQDRQLLNALYEMDYYF